MTTGDTTMIVFLASFAPKEMLIEMLERAVSNYREAEALNKSEEEMDEKFKEIVLPCILILTKVAGGGRDPFEIIKDMDNLQRAKDLLTPKKG